VCLLYLLFHSVYSIWSWLEDGTNDIIKCWAVERFLYRAPQYVLSVFSNGLWQPFYFVDCLQTILKRYGQKLQQRCKMEWNKNSWQPYTKKQLLPCARKSATVSQNFQGIWLVSPCSPGFLVEWNVVGLILENTKDLVEYSSFCL